MDYDYTIEEITRWVKDYYWGYERYMRENYISLYKKFYVNIQPPQKIGDWVSIKKGEVNSDEDYAEILSVTKKFCEEYKNPEDFPEDFDFTPL